MDTRAKERLRYGMVGGMGKQHGGGGKEGGSSSHVHKWGDKRARRRIQQVDEYLRRNTLSSRIGEEDVGKDDGVARDLYQSERGG